MNSNIYCRVIMLGLSFQLIIVIAYSQNKADVLKDIRKEYLRINNSSLSKYILEAEDYLDNTPDGGAELIGYFKKDSLLKIRERVGLSYGNQTREYYFKNGELFFVFEFFDAFVEANDSLDKSKTTHSFEGRYYFHNRKLIEKLVKGKKTIEDDQDDVARELLNAAETNRKELIKKRA